MINWGVYWGFARGGSDKREEDEAEEEEKKTSDCVMRNRVLPVLAKAYEWGHSLPGL